MRPAFVGLDLGTSGLKAVVVDARDGRVIGSAAADYPTARPEPGASEQDPAHWWEAAGRACRELLPPDDGTRVRVEGIGLSGMLPTLVLQDAAGRALGPAVTWQDARAGADGLALVEAVGAAELYATTGQRVDGRYLLPMARRLRRCAPEPTAAASHLLGAKDHLFGRLTGVLATDPSTASGYGCYDLWRGDWAADAGAVLDGLPELPPVLPSEQTFPLLPEAGSALGLPSGTPVTVGAADSVLGALGLGVRAPGDVAYLAGTSTVILGLSAELNHDPAMRYLITPMAGIPGWGLEMDLLATGSAVRWLAELCGLAPDVLVERGYGRDRLTAPVVLPHLTPGEQGALWDDSLTGAILGITLGHDAADLMRGLLTGVVVESARCLDVLAEATGRRGPVVLGGGGAHPAAAAELSAAAGRRVYPGAGGIRQHSALGAALLAGAPAADGGSPADGGEPAGSDPDGRVEWKALRDRQDERLAACGRAGRPVSGQVGGQRR